MPVAAGTGDVRCGPGIQEPGLEAGPPGVSERWMLGLGGARPLCLIAREPGDRGRVPTFLLLVSTPESTNQEGSVMHSYLLVRDSRGALPGGEMHRAGSGCVGVGSSRPSGDPPAPKAALGASWRPVSASATVAL